MRIWAFPSIYPYDYPGHRWKGTFGHRQYKGLVANGAELTVIQPVVWCPPYPFSEMSAAWKAAKAFNYPKQRVYDGLTVHHPRIPDSKFSLFFRQSYADRYVAAVKSFFKEQKITLDPKNDIFYSQWLPESVFVLKSARQLGVKCAILGIGDDIIVWPREGEKKLETFKNLIRDADIRITNADYLGKEMNKICGIEYPYYVNYFGMDYDKFKPAAPGECARLRTEYGIPTDKTVILTVGSPLVRKGWLDLFDALCEVRNTYPDFMLVGGYAGPKDLDIMAEVEKRGLTPNFFNQGEIKPEKLNEFYRMADIFCLPSHWEGLATVMSEALSSGIPAITTNICGQPEIIHHNKTGILIEPKNPPMLTAALLELLTDGEKRKRFGKAGREFIVNEWGNDFDNSKKLMKIFQTVL